MKALQSLYGESKQLWAAFVLSTGYLLFKVIELPLQYDESVTISESSIYGLPAAFTRYAQGTNNHPLLSFFNSFLALFQTWQVWVFRIPSFVSSVLLLIAVLYVAKRLLSPVLRPLVPLLIVATPLVSDYFVMDRGYVMGLMFILWAVVVLVDVIEEKWMSSQQVWRLGVLLALSIITVPSFVIDVVILACAFKVMLWRMGLLHLLWKKICAVAGIAALIILIAYAGIFQEVASKAFGVASGTNGFSREAWHFVDSLTALPFSTSLIYGILICLLALFFVLTGLRQSTSQSPVLTFIAVLFLLSVSTVFLGFARSHLLTPVLGVLIFLIAVSHFRYQNVTASILLLYVLGALIYNPWNWIHTEPEVKTVSGFSIAMHALYNQTHVPNCVYIQQRGFYLLPYEFYIRQGIVSPVGDYCPYIFGEKTPEMDIVKEFEMFPDQLDPFGVVLFRVEDIKQYIGTKE